MRVDRPDENDGPAVGYEHRGADAPVVISEIRDRERYYIEYRAAVEAEYRAAREPWEAVAPSLREAWADHEKKWPLPERPGHSPRPEDPGAWHGDGGRYLSREASAEVEQGCEKIRDVGENIIMMAMRPIEAEDPRRNLIGLDYRLKGPDRLKEKVAGILDEQPELSHYSDGARADMDRLTERGFELAKPLKNSWPSDQYKGINTQWREPVTGQLFEVQFHTRASFEAKQLTHAAYERLRNPRTSESELDELKAFQRRTCASIAVPPGAADVDHHARKERDG